MTKASTQWKESRFVPVVVTLKYTLSQTTSVWAEVDTQGFSFAADTGICSFCVRFDESDLTEVPPCFRTIKNSHVDCFRTNASLRPNK